MFKQFRTGSYRWDENGVVFFDRDPKAFSSVLDFLRRRCRVIGPPESDALLARVRDEADYFGPVGMMAQLDAETRERKRARTPRTDSDETAEGESGPQRVDRASLHQ